MSSHSTPGSPSPGEAVRSIWVLSIYSLETDALLAEHPIAAIDRSTVRALWRLSDDDPPRPLLVTSDQLQFVNEHLAEPVELRPDEEIYLEEYEG